MPSRPVRSAPAPAALPLAGLLDGLRGPRPRAREFVGSMCGEVAGPLPVLLVGLTVVTGLGDAFSFLALAHVFVANVTGNVVFLGFGLAGVGDISGPGQPDRGRGVRVRRGRGRPVGRRSRTASRVVAGVRAAVEAALVVAYAVVAQTAGLHGTADELSLVVLLAVAMGGQNAVARRLAVPDLR